MPATSSLLRPLRRLRRQLRGGHAYDRTLFAALAGLRTWRPGDLIYDVGANDGRTVLRLLHTLPKPRIVAFEPVSATFAVLESRTRTLPTVERRALALGDAPQTRTIFLHASAALNSFDPAWGEAQGSEEVRVETLDAQLAQEDAPLRLLKIDTEGHDLAVLEGARASLSAKRIDIVMVEAGFGAPGPNQPSLAQLQAFLGGFGYHLYGIYNQCRAKLSLRSSPGGARDPDILIYADAVFVAG